MSSRTAKSSVVPILGLFVCMIIHLANLSHAQSSTPFTPDQFDPSDVYFQGYLAVRSAEQLEKSGDFIRAAEKYRRADELFASVTQYYPDWKPDMVTRRHKKTNEALEIAKLKADEQLNKNRNIIAELEGGIKKSGIPAVSSSPSSPTSILNVDPMITRRLQQAEAEVDRLRKISEQQKSRAQLELQRLSQTAANDKNKADAEIRRLEQSTGTTSAQAEAKIKQLLQAADVAKATAAAELNRLEKLTGQAKANAQAEIARTREAAFQTNANSQAEIERIRQNAAQSNSNTLAELNRLKEHAAKTQADNLKEINRLREQTAQAQSDAVTKSNEFKRNESLNLSRISDLQNNRDAIEAKLKAAEADAQSLRAQLASAPVQSEIQDLNEKINRLEQERQVMGMSLNQSNKLYSEASTRISSLESELKSSQQRSADLARDLNAERDISNSVVAGQRRQLETLQNELKQKSILLSEAQTEISSLKNQLVENQSAFSQLREERNSLLLERDQMKALLKLNEAGRVQDLIEQNMALAKNLRESNETIQRLNLESNADKDAFTEALRDLAIAKSQINRLQKDKQEQDKRLAELESQLQEEKVALDNGQASADPAEVAILKEIIQRQLRVQKRRNQARNLLLDAVKEMGKSDPKLAEAIALFDSQEMVLSSDEQKLIADQQVDGEFVSPFARSREVVNEATTVLNRDVAVFDRTAAKSFLAGRLLPARELYDMILEQHPGHIPTLCKKGIVELKLKKSNDASDSFRRATELDNNNSYAYRMLGYCMMLSGDLNSAEKVVKRSVEIDPTDAKSHMLLATICYRLGMQNDAESHFKGAITADPILSEPYYNLALIYSTSGRIELAKNYYQQALERGALPDPQLENSLASQ